MSLAPATRSVRSRGRLLALAGAVALLAAVAAPPLAVSAATPYGSNLVKNGSAENGFTSWETFGSPKTVKYGSSGLGYPSKSAANAIGGGQKFFSSGPYELGACGDLQQTIKLKGIGSSIDQGKVKVRFKGYAATNGAADINAHLDLYFRDAENHQVSSNGIERTASSTNEQYRSYSVTRTLPKHTRQLRVHLWADGSSTESGDCQTAFDKISVTLIRN